MWSTAAYRRVRIACTWRAILPLGQGGANREDAKGMLCV